ncbi:MAG: hypothetical protein B6D59_03470 [Campylobacteraceae bacterium 4484_4]|nr:MAG: hypothetical protein B6D59_03470 [Campylobacteraceae bacterium 4484_4]
MTKSLHHNKTYKDLQSLFRLFIGSLFIIGGLNYLFSNMIDDLGYETQNLKNKKQIEEHLERTVSSIRDDISQMLLTEAKQSRDSLKQRIEEKVSKLGEDIRILKFGGTFQPNKNILQSITYKPKLYDNRYDQFSLLSLQKMEEIANNLKERYQQFLALPVKARSKGEKIVSDINTDLQELGRLNRNLLNQTLYQIKKIEDEIAIQKEKYLGYELLAIIFIIASLLYVSNLISNQILKTSKELEASSEEAKQLAENAKLASKTKSEFLANMSHEIRTPLNAILGFIDLLKEKETDREKLQYIKTIQSSSNTLLGIINDILDFSKIESGNLSIETIDFNTEDEFNSLADLFRAKASEKSVSLTIKMDKSMPKALKSDPLRLKQVIANLLSNAIKFTPRNGRIELAMGYSDGHLNVSVKDNGIGIPEDKQKDIFKAFSQAEAGTTRKYGGTGLGLAISSRLIQMMGGELKLESREGHGSRFFFSIPVEEGVYKKDEIKNPAETLDHLKGKKILLVEDNKANQMYMSLILKKFKLIFEIANDGLDDLILMDENMPNLNGIEATKRILSIEKEEGLAHTPIVALTANALKGDRERFLAAGMDEYLTKPINKEKLAKTFNQFMGASTTNKEVV